MKRKILLLIFVSLSLGVYFLAENYQAKQVLAQQTCIPIAASSGTVIGGGAVRDLSSSGSTVIASCQGNQSSCTLTSNASQTYNCSTLLSVWGNSTCGSTFVGGQVNTTIACSVPTATNPTPPPSRIRFTGNVLDTIGLTHRVYVCIAN